MRKIIPKIALAAVFAIALALLFTAYNAYGIHSIKKDPMGQLGKSFNKTKSVLQQDFFLALPESISKTIQQGALDLSIKSNGAEMQGRLFLRNNAIALTGATIADGQQKVGFDFWVNEKAVVVKTQTEDAENAYGLNLETLADDFKSSPLLEMLGISYEEIASMLDASDAIISNNKKDNNDLRTLADTKKQLNDLIRGSSFAVSEVKVKENNSEINAYRISITMNAIQLCKVVDIYHTWLLETETFKSMLSQDAEAKNDLQKQVDALKQEIIETNATILTDFYLHGKNELILYASFRMDWLIEDKAATIAASLDFGGNPASASVLTAKISREYPGEARQYLTAEYHRTQAHNMPTRKILITTKEGTVTLLDMQKNDITGAFDMTLFDGEITLQGEVKETDGIRSIIFNLEDDTTAQITLIAEATIPETPAYQNLCLMTKEELEELLAPVLGGGELEPDEFPEPEGGYVELTVMGDDNVLRYASFPCTSYTTIGEMLIGESIAVLDASGRIEKVLTGGVLGDFDQDPGEVPGEQWQIFIDGVLIEGSLYEIQMTSDITLSIFSVTGK